MSTGGHRPEERADDDERHEGLVIAPNAGEDATPVAGDDAPDQDEIVFPSALTTSEAESDESIALSQELAETRSRLIRQVADFDNFRKRVEREREEVVQFANTGILKELLPLLDNLERALAAAEQTCEREGSLHEGVRMVVQQFQALIEKVGVQRIAGRGAVFDPTWHEAVARVSAPDSEPGTVVEELLPGYTLRGRLLRPSRVTVAAAPDGVPADVSSQELPLAIEEAERAVAALHAADDDLEDAFDLDEDTVPNASRPSFDD